MKLFSGYHLFECVWIISQLRDMLSLDTVLFNVNKRLGYP